MAPLKRRRCSQPIGSSRRSIFVACVQRLGVEPERGLLVFVNRCPVAHFSLNRVETYAGMDHMLELALKLFDDHRPLSDGQSGRGPPGGRPTCRPPLPPTQVFTSEATGQARHSVGRRRSADDVVTPPHSAIPGTRKRIRGPRKPVSRSTAWRSP